mmetsp:Transcript_16539/g.26212  ORF Transcript_16539/g.26212 Transcript_16539/m.26212 type:complete len:542 (+) Transcript_16539:87-1712(+)
MAQQRAKKAVDEEVLSVLKVDGKGWNIQLFEDQSELKGCVCASCHGVCDNAAELDCDHDEDEEILAYCHSCLQRLIAENHGKCPINSHENPLIARSRTNRTRIAKLTAICPYSTHSRMQQPLRAQNHNDDNHGVQDTLGAANDEKEGAVAIPPPLAPQQPARPQQARCEWKGKLSDLIHEHITECVQRNDPVLLYKQQIKSLQSELAENTSIINALQHQLTEQATNFAKKENESSVRILSLQNEVNALKRNVAEKETRISEMVQFCQQQHEQKLSELSELNERLKAQNSEHEKRIAVLSQQLSDSSELNEKLKRRVNEFTKQRQNEAAQQEEEEEQKLENEAQKQAKHKLDASKFTFNQQPKSKCIEIRNGNTIKNTQCDGNWHSITFGAVIPCAEYKKYRIKFKINKMSAGFFIGFASSSSDMRDIEDIPGVGKNKSTSTGIQVGNDNNFYLYDKDHFDSRLPLSCGSWSGWYSNRIGFEFLMEFDFVCNAFILYGVSAAKSKSNRKLLHIANIPKHSVVPIFCLINKGDEIEIVECVLN